MSELPTSSKIDGHDIGSGEMNIFICTDDPLAAFVHVKAVLKHPSDWENMKAGFRKISEDEYSVLWPKELDRFEVV